MVAFFGGQQLGTVRCLAVPRHPATSVNITKRSGDDREWLGDDWWPYGIAANRAAIDVVLRSHHEQGLTERRFAIEDGSVPGLREA